jgi:hypothetical protein
MARITGIALLKSCRRQDCITDTTGFQAGNFRCFCTHTVFTSDEYSIYCKLLNIADYIILIRDTLL